MYVYRRIVTSPLKVFSLQSELPPPFSDPRKLRLLLVESVTGRSLLKLPLKLSNVRSPRALAGKPQRDIAAEGVDGQIVAVAPVACLRR